MARARSNDLDLTHAMRGALAGLAGGAAVLVLGVLVRRGVVSTADTGDDEWERLVRRAARASGVSLDKRQARVGRVVAQLTYSALVGALYGLTRTRGQLGGALLATLNSGLVHAASLPAAARATAHRGPKRRVGRRRGGVNIPVGSAALYGMTTSAAFSALERV